VLDLFRSASWRTADADAICRGLYDDPESGFAAACRERWGEAFFTGGAFDRKKIAQLVFDAPEELRRLTELMYPHLERVLDDFVAAARHDGADAAVEIPLLYENGMEKRFDAVLTVWAPAELRHSRLRKLRHFDDAEIRRREALQMDPDEKLERADYALVNSGSAAELAKEFSLLLERLGKRF
jgi:dephospho-CoA kinase